MKVTIQTEEQFNQLSYQQVHLGENLEYYQDHLHLNNAVCSFCGKITKLDWTYYRDCYDSGDGFPVELTLCCDRIKEMHKLQQENLSLKNQIKTLQDKVDSNNEELEEMIYNNENLVNFIVRENKILQLKEVKNDKSEIT